MRMAAARGAGDAPAGAGLVQFSVRCLPAQRAAVEAALAAVSAQCPVGTVQVLDEGGVLTAAEQRAITLVGHRGANDALERLFAEGLGTTLGAGPAHGLPALTQPWDARYSTRDLQAPARTPLAALLGRPLLHTTDHNLGADVVWLLRVPDTGTYVLYVLQLKRGTTPIGGSKSTTGGTNQGRGIYHIHQRLALMADRLVARLGAAFPAAAGHVRVELVLVTTAPLNKPARAFAADKGLLVIQGDAPFAALMPARCAEALALVGGGPPT